jgi:hypothetical protein
MRQLIVVESLSLDGVMQGPGGPEEDRSGGFEHGGWGMSYFDDVAGGPTRSWPPTGHTHPKTTCSPTS